jgi:hypothetical protein
MFRNRFYYSVKPLVPRSVRMRFRRWLARRKLGEVADVWPIHPGSEKPPEGWRGWPEGKSVAFVLTHDVEGAEGLKKVRPLAELEMSLGFRSNFNFIPEGQDRVSQELRDWLVGNGFEVGVHDLRHDGKLYRSRAEFRRNATRINQHLKNWGAVGFRSGFMLHQLGWLHDLDIRYDMSTFDTDPFEPQPDGVDTIFPFWVPRTDGGGYVELPYTLVQDFNLFVILEEKTIAIWKNKLDWIAQKGGMILLNTHPDYMSFDKNNVLPAEFPVSLYEDLLRYVKSKYAGRYWHSLPKEMAEFAFERRSTLRLRKTELNLPSWRAASSPLEKIWIDLDNTPHIPFFRPIIRELEQRGYEVVLTARDAYQVCEMASTYGLHPTVIGRHYGKHRLWKLLGFLYRTLQLVPFALREKPALALNHGSRSQLFLCNLLRIPSVTIMDYEHGKGIPGVRPTWMIVPDAFPDGLTTIPVRRYSGIKEDVYAPEFKPDSSILGQLGLSDLDLIVTVRPPASEAHYHNAEGEVLFEAFINRVCDMDGVKAVVLPRNKRQEAQIRSANPRWFRDSKIIIPPTVVDGLNLLWHSDLAVSGGGTMNREAAALGVPVYSIFRGKKAAVDIRLQEEGRLILIENTDQVHSKIALRRRSKDRMVDSKQRAALPQIIGYIEEILQLQRPSKR